MRKSSGTNWLILAAAILASSSVAATEPAPGARDGRELPIYRIPNLPGNGEAYYAPDGVHLIAQVTDPDAQDPGKGKVGGALTYTFTDTGKDIRRINDRGMDACSYFYPDGKRLLWTSTRDHVDDMPAGNWSDDADYPQGSELYSSDLDGKNIQRLTNNRWYDAEATVSPDGKWIVFGRQIDGNADLWRMKADGTEQTQLTNTKDWQEGEAYFLPDNETVIFRAWKQSEKKRLEEQDRKNGTRSQTPMNIFSMKIVGPDRNILPRTFTNDMNWSPYPAPDGRHFLTVRIVDGSNWELFLADMAGGEPVRLTYNPGWDGMGAFSPDGRKMVYTRSEPGSHELYSYVMDVSSLDVGPANYKGVPPKAEPPAGWRPDPDFAAWQAKSDSANARP
jgi:Tol biopolymer transport system component